MLSTPDGLPFTTGSISYQDRDPGAEEASSKIYVPLYLNPIRHRVLAQLDTAAPWSILEPALAEALGLLGGTGCEVTVDSRLGSRTGRLERVTVTLEAEQGVPLRVEATFFACADWPYGLNFIGYNGFLERIRFALDPERNRFHFGPMG